MNLYNKYIESTFFNVIIKLLVIATTLVITPIFIRKMGEELYGIWILVFSIIGYFSIVVSGIPGGIIKHIAETKEKTEKQIQVINIGFISYSLLGLVIGSIIFIFAENILQFFKITEEYQDISVLLLKISASFIIILWPLSVFESVLKGLLEYKVISIVKGITAFSNSIIILVALVLNFPIAIILIFSYTITVISSLLLFYFVKKEVTGFKLSLRLFDFSIFKSITQFTLGMLVLELISIMAYQVDKLIIGHYLSVKDITIYFVVTIAFYKLRIIYSMLSEVILPVIFEAKSKNDIQTIRKAVNKGTKYINIVYVPIVVLAVVISKMFLSLWMGPEYEKYGWWSAAFVFQHFLGAVYIAFPGKVSIGMGKLKQNQIINSILVIINVIISIVGIPYFGFASVLIGSIFISFVNVFGFYRFYCKLIGIPVKDIIYTNIKITVSLFIYMIAGLIIINFLPTNWLALVMFSFVFIGLIYFSMYVFFVEEKEKLFIQNKIQQITSNFKNNRLK